MQSQAALFAAGIKSSPGAFAGMFAELVALGNQVDAARSLAYLLNANLTLSGGCPNPPLTEYFTDQLGDAIVRAVGLGKSATDTTPQPLARTGNLSDTQVASALIAGVALAAKSCGPPNHLSSNSAEQAREKYKNSSCYYVGPVLATPMNKSAVFAATLALAVGEATVENPWSLGAVLGGIQDCVTGPEDLQDPPTWLPKSNGPIDDAEKAETIPAISLQRVQSQDLPPTAQMPKLNQATTQQQIVPLSSVGGRRRLLVAGP
ncbi:g3321 [Coccomyxa elongata]